MEEVQTVGLVLIQECSRRLYFGRLLTEVLKYGNVLRTEEKGDDSKCFIYQCFYFNFVLSYHQQQNGKPHRSPFPTKPLTYSRYLHYANKSFLLLRFPLAKFCPFESELVPLVCAFGEEEGPEVVEGEEQEAEEHDEEVVGTHAEDVQLVVVEVEAVDAAAGEGQHPQVHPPRQPHHVQPHTGAVEAGLPLGEHPQAGEGAEGVAEVVQEEDGDGHGEDVHGGEDEQRAGHHVVQQQLVEVELPVVVALQHRQLQHQVQVHSQLEQHEALHLLVAAARPGGEGREDVHALRPSAEDPGEPLRPSEHRHRTHRHPAVEQDVEYLLHELPLDVLPRLPTHLLDDHALSHAQHAAVENEELQQLSGEPHTISRKPARHHFRAREEMTGRSAAMAARRKRQKAGRQKAMIARLMMTIHLKTGSDWYFLAPLALRCGAVSTGSTYINDNKLNLIVKVQMATVPRLEVPSIAKTQKPDPTCLFLNSYYLPHSRTIEAVPYYTRRKQQLTTQPQPTHPSDPSLTSERIKQQIAQAVGNQRGINPLLAPHLRTLRVEPVVTDNCFSNFSEEQYPITDHEKLRVCEERYFPLQNYYNYVYELEHHKGISRVAEVAEQIMPKVTGLHQQSESSYSAVPAPAVNSSPQDLQISRVKGFYSTQFQPRGNRTAEMADKSEEQLARHLGWNEDRRKVVFVPKEGRRLELSRSDNRRY